MILFVCGNDASIYHGSIGEAFRFADLVRPTIMRSSTKGIYTCFACPPRPTSVE